MSTFVIGDIHGGFLSLEQCLERSGFNDQKDTLISLGDVCDGWPETKKCIDRLLKIKSHIAVKGNHDDWAMEWMMFGHRPRIWVSQGGQATIDSYKDGIPDSHSKYLLESLFKYEDEKNRLFVHGGFNWFKPIKESRKSVLLWDRSLFEDAMMNKSKYGKYDEIYIGHTPTSYWSSEPMNRGNVWMLDQGGGWEGKLSIMNVDTHEFWQSDIVQTLYPDFRGRG